MAGTVYVSGFSTLYAVNVSDGTIKWSTPNTGGEQSSPAVTNDRLYVTYTCRTLALSPSTGAVLWTQGGFCGGSAGRTPVFYNERVYARDPSLGGLTLDSGSGVQVSIFDSIPAPAFNGTTGFFLTSFGVEARDIFTRAPKWSFPGDLTLSSPPIVVNGVVYVGSTSGKLYALDENTGTNIWTGNVGAPVNRPDELNSSEPLTGLAAGEGLVVVPASNLVVAYQTANVTTPPVIYAEEGTNNAAAVYSVSFVRGPFRKTNPNNLSTDQRTRIILFTSNLGLTQVDLADPSVLVVELAGVSLPVENVGPATIPGLSSSYIVVRLPDNVPTGPQELRVKLRGAASDPKMVTISP
jgi:hypothetical protein